jgi:hypothetical protein
MVTENSKNKDNKSGTADLSNKQLLVLLNNPNYKRGIIEDSDLSLLVSNEVVSKINNGEIDNLDPEAFSYLLGCAEWTLENYGDTIVSYSDKDDSIFPDPIHINGIPGVYGVYYYGWGFNRFFDTKEDALSFAEQEFAKLPKIFD